MASTKLLGKKTAPAATAPAPAATEKKKGGLSALASKAKAPKAEAAAPVTAPSKEEDRVVDIAKMKNDEIDALVKSEEMKVPDDWATMKLAAKKKWLEANAETTDGEAAPAPKKERAKKAKVEAPIVKYKTPAVDKVKIKISSEKAAKALAGITIDGTDKFAEIIQYVENLSESSAKELAGTLAEGTGFAEFKLGGILSRIQEEGWFKPYSSFREYVEAEHGVKYRAAAYAIQIYNDLAKLNISYERVKEIQWTKLRTISGVLTQDNIEKMVAVAKKQTVVQLVETVKNMKNKDKKLSGAEDPSKTKVVTFKLHGNQEAVIQAALEKAKEVGNTTVATQALEYICLDFMGSSKASIMEQLKQVGIDKAIEAFGEAFPDASLSLVLPEEAKAAA
jgi:hypothetical protein